ncbi:MAG: endolytic transglycosylase MltG [Bacteroidota bacterium]
MKKLITIITVLFIVGLGIGGYLYSIVYMSNVSIPGSEKAYVYIRNNAGFEEVLDSLDVYLDDVSSFERVAKLKKYPELIRTGKFEIKNNWSNNDLVNHLRSGNQAEVKLVFNNADSVEELAGKISKQIEADSTDIVNYIFDPAFLKENKFTNETVGSLFIPNTYFVYWNTDAETFTLRMLKEYRKFWNEDRLAKAKKIGLKPSQVSTLASIVQKETVKRDERRTVAGLYMNRLNNNWKLESDPTVIFALKKQAGFKIEVRRVLYKDLKVDSPYNTYMNSGLPPGPITIPEIDAIDAVLNYGENAYFFMCANPERMGYHSFAKSLRQHNRNARKYAHWLNQQNIKR